MTTRKLIITALLALSLYPASAPAAAKNSPCGQEPSLGRGMHQTLLKVHALYQKKEYKEALRLLDQYADYSGASHHRLFFMRGILHYQVGSKKKACNDFKEALKSWPCFTPALRNLANVQFDLGRYQAAAHTAGRAYEMVKPPDPELAYMAAVFYLAAHKPKSALPYLKTLVSRKNPRKKWMLAMVRARMDLKQWKAAAEVLARVLRRYPGDASLWRTAASLELRRKSYAKAASALEVAVRLQGPQKGDWRSLAELHRVVGAPAKSAEYFVKAFGGKPTGEEWMILARSHLMAQQLDQAIAATRKALKLKPSRANQAFLADLLLRKRAYAKACRAYLKAAKSAKKAKSDRCAGFAMQAGYCALRTEDLDKALQAFALAGKLAAPRSRTAKDAAQWCKDVRGRKQALSE